MNSTPEAATPLDPADPLLRRLADAVSLARSAAEEDAGDGEVGAHVGVELEDAAAVTHLFDANTPGYRGWRWAVTVASAGLDSAVTISEVVVLPGPDALVAPEWVPWQQRVQAGDLGVGDLMPTAPDDPRLVPGYVESDDVAIEETAKDVGLGRVRVMSRGARLDAASRWQSGEFGPRSDMARGAPGHCATCGFYLPLAGSLAAAFGVCGNEIAPADGHLVHAEYGCGAHSEAEVEQVSPVLVADLIYDDNAMLDIELVEISEPPVAKPEIGEPELAELPPAEPQLAEPDLIEPSATDSLVAEPGIAELQAAESAIVEPEVAKPLATEPPIAEFQFLFAEPSAIETQEAGPGIAEPGVVESRTAEPPVAELEVAEPEAALPEVAEPEIAERATVESLVVEPEVALPEVAQLEIAEPEVAKPEAVDGGVESEG